MIATSKTDNDLYDYFNRCYWSRQLGKSPRTKRLYLLTLDRLGDFLRRPPTLDDLNDETVCAFLSHRLEEGLAPHTVDKERDKLLALANFAAKKRHIEQFLDVPPIRPAKIIPRCWRQDHVTMLLNACRATCGAIGGAPAGDWWYAFHAVALTTGERTEALLALRWEWFDGRYLHVPAEVRKGGRTPMVYDLPSEACAAIENLRGKTEGLIFAVQWARGHKSGSFYRHYKKLLERAGLPTGRRFKPQCLRRTFASHLEAAGGDATQALAHTDRKTTVGSYLDRSVTDAGKTGAGAIVSQALGLDYRAASLASP